MKNFKPSSCDGSAKILKRSLEVNKKKLKVESEVFINEPTSEYLKISLVSGRESSLRRLYSR